MIYDLEPSRARAPCFAGVGMVIDVSTENSSPLGYEQARDELIEVVRRLEAGGITLEESLALWERGEELARVCQQWLDGARARLEAAMHRSAPAAEAETADLVEDEDEE